MGRHIDRQARRLAGAARAAAVVTAAVLLLLPGGARVSADLPTEHAVAIVQPALVYIETSWSAWVRDHEWYWLNDGAPYEWTSRCSGFVVNPSGYIVTAGHCVDDSRDYGASWDAIVFGVEEWLANGWIEPNQADGLLSHAFANWHVEGAGANTPPDRDVVVLHHSPTSAGTRWSARVVDVMSVNDGDVALLKVEADKLPTIQLARNESITVGTSVLSVGYPASSDQVTDPTLEPTFKDGQISARRTREDGRLPVYEISAALTGGMSGGPTVDLDGDVVGVNSFTIAGEEQQFNFVSPVSLVAEMLSRNGVSNNPGEVDELYRQALDDYFGRDYAAALTGFEAVLRQAPSHAQARTYRALAAQASPTPEPTAAPTPVPASSSAVPSQADRDEEGMPWLLVSALGGLVAVGLAGGAAWFLLLRPRPGPGEAGAAATVAHAESTPELEPEPEPTAEPPVEPGWVPPGWDVEGPHEPAFVEQPSGRAGRHGHDVFVSYSTPDKPAADAIVARFEHEGIRCWMAPRDVIPGEVWSEAIVAAIEASRVMVVVLSGEANQSAQVVREVERAVANDVVIIPFRIESVEPTGAMAYFLASEHWLDAMTPPLDTHIAHLVKVVQSLLETTSAPKPAGGPRG
jgi:serine protease Do